MKRVWGAFFFCLLLLSACEELPAEAPPVMPAEAVPAEASTLPQAERAVRNPEHLSLAVRPPVTLNPLLNEDATVDHLLKLLFEPLVIMDESLKPADHLASYNFSSDYTSVTLTLRRDAIWSDAMPVTADDVIFSIQFLQDAPDTAIYKPFVQNIASCEKLDTKTVKITYTEADSGSAYRLQFPIIPQHYYFNQTNPASHANMNPLGNGLYVFDALRPLVGITLTQNVYSFRPVARIGTVQAIFLPDDETRLHAFHQGLIDVITLELTEWSKQHSVKKTRNQEFAAMYFDFIGFNFNHPWLSHHLFRQALATAYDADEAISRIYLTHALRAYAPINPASWLYDHNLPALEHDREAAYELLLQAQREQFDRPIELAFPFRILVNIENDERVLIAEGFAAAMQGLGLETVIQALPFDEYAQKLEARDFDIFVGCFSLDVVPDLRFAFHSGENIFNYSDAHMDELLAAAVAAPSEAELVRTLSELQHYIAQQIPVISLAFRQSAVLTDVRVTGDLNPALWYSLAGVNGWTLE